MPPARSHPLKSATSSLSSAVAAALARLTTAVLGEDEQPHPIARMSTGVETIDAALGGGWPRGRVAEVFGPPQSGKTTLALRAAAAAQRGGEAVAFIDVDGGLDVSGARALGVDLSRLAVAVPRSAEEALQVVSALFEARAAGLVIVDSVAGLVPEAELRAPLGGDTPLQARLLSRALRRLVVEVRAADGVLLFVNQTRVTFLADGRSVLVGAGGNALPAYAAARLELRAGGGVEVVKHRFPTPAMPPTITRLP